MIDQEKTKQLWREIIENIWENSHNNGKKYSNKEFTCKYCGEKEICCFKNKTTCFECRVKKQAEYYKKHRRKTA